MASLERTNILRTKFIMESLTNLIRPAKLILAVALLQGAYAGQAIIVRMAMNQGMSHYIFIVYRMAFATVLIAPFALILDRFVLLMYMQGNFLFSNSLASFKKD